MLVKKLRAGMAAHLQQQIEGQPGISIGGSSGGKDARSGEVVAVIARLLEDEETALRRDVA